MSLYSKNKSAGFTLIELLVVVAIIGLLSSIVLASLNGARERARDVERKTNLKQLQTALNIYYSDHGNYPSTDNHWTGNQAISCDLVRGLSGAGGYIPNLAPTYIPILPIDSSIPNEGCNGYIYYSDGNNYKLLWHYQAMGSVKFPDPGQPFSDPKPRIFALMLCSGEPACSDW